MDGGKVLMVTSLLENEGKSTVAVNLALAMEQKGKRVLLIDCDLRKPACGMVLGQSKFTYGLNDILGGKGYFGTPNEKKKIRVWIQAGLHGNEPAGPEAACMLADYLLNTPEGAELLKKVSLALVPVANTDGYAMQIRKSGSGYDLNRDQSKLADPVTLLLKKAYKEWNPEIALDIHEFNPFRKEFELLRGTKAKENYF